MKNYIVEIYKIDLMKICILIKREYILTGIVTNFLCLCRVYDNFNIATKFSSLHQTYENFKNCKFCLSQM